MLTRHQGGAFLFGTAARDDWQCPEDFAEEGREIARTMRDFATREVQPQWERLEGHEWEVSKRLLREVGHLGFVGAEVPEEYGGLGLDRVTASLIMQELGPGGASFALTYSVQTGIGLVPLLYFGTQEQKRRYLPALASGRQIAAYSLTEPGSGSDALSARTTARLSADGTHYLLNGTKQWTTNAGLADLFVVYAKVDGQQFTAFLVERGFPGVSIGREERKMGYGGSSTAQVILEDAQVPVANVLHAVGKGHQVAFNTLNIGRFKLAPMCLGGSITALNLSTRYAQERQQFGRPIASFRLIGRKLADMAARIYALEAVTYRLAALLDEATAGLDLAGDASEGAIGALSEYAIECSIAKVFATETLDRVVDEAVQIHGGYGYMREYAVERAYRDSRVNRIFEGTNEINRLLIPTMLFRRAAQGAVPSLDGVQQEQAAFLARTAPPTFTGPLDREYWLLEVARAHFWQVALAARTQYPKLDEEQELQAILGDLAIGLFVIESALTRAARAQSSPRAALHLDLAQAASADTFAWLVGRAREAHTHLGQPETLARLETLAEVAGVDRLAVGRRIAEEVLAAEGWPLAL